MRLTATLLIAMLALTGCGSRSAPAGPATRATPMEIGHHRIVAWSPLPPTRPHLAVHVVPARPDPAAAGHARRCRATDLSIHSHATGAAAGTAVKSLLLALRPGRRPCAVDGRPTVDGLTADNHPLRGTPGPWTLTYHHAVLLTGHERAEVQVTWPDACLASSGRAHLTAHLAGGAWTFDAGLLGSRCESSRGTLTQVFVTHVFPQPFHAARRSTAYDAVHAGGPNRLIARLDRPIDFVVTLVARHDVVLDPCPDYRLGATPGTGQRYALNCAAVPWRDSLGRPYLPAGRPVRFAMHVAGTDGITQKFWWGIVAAGSPPFLGGVVAVR